MSITQLYIGSTHIFLSKIYTCYLPYTWNIPYTIYAIKMSWLLGKEFLKKMFEYRLSLGKEFIKKILCIRYMPCIKYIPYMACRPLFLFFESKWLYENNIR
jgi:hypothetical protein